MHDLGTLGGNRSDGFGINSSGHVTGSSRNSSGRNRAFLYDGTTMHDLGTLGGSDSYGFGINDAGNVVGSARNSSNTRNLAFLYNGSTMVDLNDMIDSGLGYTLFAARGINNRGQIIANASTSMGIRAVLLTPETSAVPEPSALILLSLCTGAAVFMNRRRNKRLSKTTSLKEHRSSQFVSHLSERAQS